MKYKKRKKSLRKAIFQLLGGNVFSKALGVFREILTAYFFGTGQVIGAYRVAQTGTLVPINFLTSDSLNSAFVPQYRQLLSVSRDSAQTLFWSIFILFGFITLLLTSGLWLAAEQWIGVLAPGLPKAVSALAVDMLRVMAVGVTFYLFSALLMFLGMANEDFLPMAIRPSLQNIGLIAGAIAAFSLGNARLLAWGFTLSYVMFFFGVLFRSYHKGFLKMPNEWAWLSVKEVLSGFWRTLRPLLLLPILLQGNIAIERAVGSLIGLTVLSSIDYAKFISETVILLISMPVAFAGLGRWSEMSNEHMKQHLVEILTPILLLAVPIAAFLSFNAHAVVEMMYSRGAFNTNSVAVTADILIGASVGVWAQVVGYVLIKALNAQCRNGVVLKVMMLSLFANAAFNLLLYSKLGALTLGLGNSVYGLILLVGTLSALGLWRDFFERGWFLFFAAIGYFLINSSLPRSNDLFQELIVVTMVFLLYWFLCILAVPHFRKSMLRLFRRN